MIADKYGIDVELIRGKDWVEVLEILKGFTPLKDGGLAGILQAPKMKHGGRIGFKDGTNWYNRVYPFDIMPWPLKGLAKHFGQIKGSDPSTWFGGMTGKSLGILDKRNKRLKLALENKAKGGLAGILEV